MLTFSVIFNLFHSQVQVASVVPPLFMFLARHPLVDKFDLSSLSMINSGGAALGRDVLSAFKQKFPKVLVTTGKEFLHMRHGGEEEGVGGD